MEGPSVAFPWPWIRPRVLVHPWNILSATVNAVLPDHELTHQINARGFYFLLSFFFFFQNWLPFTKKILALYCRQ